MGDCCWFWIWKGMEILIELFIDFVFVGELVGGMFFIFEYDGDIEIIMGFMLVVG